MDETEEWNPKGHATDDKIYCVGWTTARGVFCKIRGERLGARIIGI
ncbi:hypothetical protein M7I_3815 [Glarea lozoyensis 74030]|uniref:Uncharacterized protein n=1 Tax=Glarea lozoyensis (strain ATCC 74030 / MF5533) TaxID=1104152 RepID=H0EMH8_GLAL7|nr:hypothetical protein M7I_3815 [Glarea lozoyensis 74030]